MPISNSVLPFDLTQQASVANDSAASFLGGDSSSDGTETTAFADVFARTAANPASPSTAPAVATADSLSVLSSTQVAAGFLSSIIDFSDLSLTPVTATTSEQISQTTSPDSTLPSPDSSEQVSTLETESGSTPAAAPEALDSNECTNDPSLSALQAQTGILNGANAFGFVAVLPADSQSETPVVSQESELSVSAQGDDALKSESVNLDDDVEAEDESAVSDDTKAESFSQGLMLPFFGTVQTVAVTIPFRFTNAAPSFSQESADSTESCGSSIDTATASQTAARSEAPVMNDTTGGKAFDGESKPVSLIANAGGELASLVPEMATSVQVSNQASNEAQDAAEAVSTGRSNLSLNAQGVVGANETPGAHVSAPSSDGLENDSAIPFTEPAPTKSGVDVPLAPDFATTAFESSASELVSVSPTGATGLGAVVTGTDSDSQSLATSTTSGGEFSVLSDTATTLTAPAGAFAASSTPATPAVVPTNSGRAAADTAMAASSDAETSSFASVVETEAAKPAVVAGALSTEAVSKIKAENAATTTALKAAPVVQEKIAADVSARFSGRNIDRASASTLNKKGALIVDQEDVKKRPFTVGIENANSVAPMVHDIRQTRFAALDGETFTPASGLGAVAAGVSGDVAQPAETAAPVSAAVQAVRQITDAVDALHATNRSGVNLKLQFDDVGIAVSVEYRNGEVRATFHTDSAELREALSSAWQTQAVAVADQKPYRFADPVFASSGNNSNSSHNQSFSTGGDSQRQFSQQSRQNSSSGAADSPLRSRGTSSAAPASGSRLTTPSTDSRRLHAFA